MNRRKASLVAVCLLLVLTVGLLARPDLVFDAWRLHGYQAPAEVSRLADKTTMTDGARRVFYVYHPQLNDKATFNSNCSGTEQTIVLGCYIKHQGIYLYAVSDERLNGVIEVTAAHEMLHAQYDRLSSRERAKIDRLTQQVADTITDERLKQTIENYRQKDPSVVPNELHSILATEVRTLPAELEAYYARYFSNRLAVVNMADAYKQAFTDRENEVASIDAQLTQLKSQIESLNSSLSTQQSTLKSQYDSLQQLKQSGQTQEYNDGVPGYNQAVAAYNAAVRQQRSLVNQYNELVEKRNGLATEENELIKAIDSRETIQTQ